jgi:hypothetical protein
MSKVCLFLIAFAGVVTVCAQPTPKQINTIDSALTKLHERGMLNGVFLCWHRMAKRCIKKPLEFLT